MSWGSSWGGAWGDAWGSGSSPAVVAEQNSGGYLGVWAAHPKKKRKEPEPELPVVAVPRPVLTLKPNVASLVRLEAATQRLADQISQAEMRRLLLIAQEEQDIAFVLMALIRAI